MSCAILPSDLKPTRVRQDVTFPARLVAALLAAFLARPGIADVLPEPQQVSPNAWAWIGPYGGPSKANRGFRMNLGFVVGKDAVGVIDSGYSPEMAESMLRHIRQRTPLPVRYLINTNSQPHRFLGNDVFRKAGASILAGREAAERMAGSGAMFAAASADILDTSRQPVPAPPDRLLSEGERVVLDLGGGVTVRVLHIGTAHTNGSLIVEVSPDRTVFAGDVLYGGRLLAILPDSRVKAWIAAYEKLRAFREATFVPGHGQPGPLTEFEHPTLAYLVRLKRHMDEAVKRNEDIQKATTRFEASPWKSLANFNELNGRNAFQAYLESEVEGF